MGAINSGLGHSIALVVATSFLLSACHTYKPIAGPTPAAVDSAVRRHATIRFALANGRTVSIWQPIIRNDSVVAPIPATCGFRLHDCTKRAAIAEINGVSFKTLSPSRMIGLAGGGVVAAAAVYMVLVAISCNSGHDC